MAIFYCCGTFSKPKKCHKCATRILSGFERFEDRNGWNLLQNTVIELFIAIFQAFKYLF